MNKMKILVTGSAGFIGSSLVLRLLQAGHNVIGIDNHNDYYDPKLKEARIKRLSKNASYSHHILDISDMHKLDQIFQINKPDSVVNLAAQAGVRYSIENPAVYVNSNIVGFANILECSRQYDVQHLVYASSSSVYGANTKLPFSVHENVDHPLSLYAASKKSNELMAHTYSHLFQIPTTGLRFFTVYGPWGRPDMALFKFTKAIIDGEPIKLFNNGKHKRDFTYIDDVTEAIFRVLMKPAKGNKSWIGNQPDPGTSIAPWRIYNVGNNKPIDLMDYIKVIEDLLGKSAIKEFYPLQSGDVPETYADVKDLEVDFDYKPSTDIKIGVKKFIDWYIDYYTQEI
jgi:UDP-glucuronate 4-epimerase